ncbi:hypothetical protein F4779DRAFT_78427 [Xylariaceae sp. FL0662B]|nr:hypothetical protein F4779DRAFT_78427 [Xylariaceae sp. FL0662B]
MAHFSKSKSFLLQLPVELINMALANLQDPKDYFNVASTCRSSWSTLDHDREVILRDARLLRASAHIGVRYDSVLAWCLSHDQHNTSRLCRIAQVYSGVFPEILRGSSDLQFGGLSLPRSNSDGHNGEFVSLFVWSVEVGNLELLRALVTMGIVSEDKPFAQNPLQIAIHAGHERVALWLLVNFDHNVTFGDFGISVDRFGIDSPVSKAVLARSKKTASIGTLLASA